VHARDQQQEPESPIAKLPELQQSRLLPRSAIADRAWFERTSAAGHQPWLGGAAIFSGTVAAVDGPLVSKECRPTFARVLNREWGETGVFVKVNHGLSFIIIAKDSRESMKPELAIALAHVISVTAPARARDVPRPTVFWWSMSPRSSSVSVIDRRIARVSALLEPLVISHHFGSSLHLPGLRKHARGGRTRQECDERTQNRGGGCWRTRGRALRSYGESGCCYGT
jgi:hypothetical protein